MTIKRLLTLTFVLWSAWLTAQKLPFQGKLTENDEPVTGSRSFTFGFESVNWTETHADVSILDGYYSVVLGSINPIPDSLFDNSDEAVLSIKVGDTDLSPITIYAPLGSKAGRFIINETPDTSTVAIYAINKGTGTSFGQGSRVGAYIEATGEGLNTGILAHAENGRSISNHSDLTDPSVYITGQLTSVGGTSDVGSRVIQGQYTAAGGGHGIALSGYAGGGGMNWAVWGRANSGAFTTDSTQVGAYVEAYGTGAGEHIGVKGLAYGANSARNIGIYGSAFNGPEENWAGWFDGDVNVNGKFLVNGEPFAGSLDSLRLKDVQLLDDAGSLKSHLNIYEPTNAGSLVLYGANDSTKVILGSAGGGYGGYLGLYDSLRNVGAQVRVTNQGLGNLYTYSPGHNNVGWFGGIGNDGFMQLVSYDDSEVFTGALLAGSFADGSLPELYMEGSKQENFGLGRFRVTQLGENVDEQTAQLEINRSNGGGQARISINQNLSGSDPSGANGYLELWGDTTPNVSIGARDWQEHDHAHMNFYGTKTDGGTWYNSTMDLGVEATSDGVSEFSYINMHNNQDGTQNNSVSIMSNINETGAGGMELRDSVGTNRIILNASNGNISSNRDDGSSAANIFQNSNNGGIAIQDASDVNKFFYEASQGELILRNDAGLNTIDLQGNSGNLYVKGEDNTAGDDIRVGIEVISDGNGSSNGRFFVKDSTAADVIMMEKNGDIYAQGTVYSNGNALTSDRRYKRDITSLSNALENTRQLRGATYYWKDASRGKERQIGVIAQEVEQVYPEFVHTNAEGFKSVNYAQMVAVLIEAVKELDAKVTSLENENSKLKAELATSDTEQIESLKSDIELIKRMLTLKVEQESGSVGQNK